MPADETHVTRRRALALIGASVTPVATKPTSAASATGRYAEEVQSLMEAFDIEGVSIAIVEPDGADVPSPVYRRAFGTNRVYDLGVDRQRDPLETYHRLRLASVTKTLTSAAILRMIDFDYLAADDEIFGEDAILDPEEWGRPDTACPLTVSRYLNHAYEIEEEQDADWTRAVYRIPPEKSLKEMVRAIHERFTFSTSSESDGQHEDCGRPNDYYNYGYGVLGAVIDTLYRDGDYAAGRGFESFVREYLLDPCGASEMSTVDTQYGTVENEAYHHSDDGDPYADWLARERAWGWSGWAATPLEVATFGQHTVTLRTFPPSIVGDYTELADYGWETYGDEPYVGHAGSQVGVMATLRCHPDRSFCVLINTRNRDTWEDDPRGPLTERTRELAEEMV